MMLTPAEIASATEVTGNGQLDPDLWVSTQSFLPKPQNDRWFRARIDKVTGNVSYQIYFVLTSRGEGFRPKTLTFEGANGLSKAEVERIDFDANCMRYGCYITEQAVATLTRADLDHAAQGASPGQDVSWPAKLFGQYEAGIEFGTFKTEIAGFLLAVDREILRLKK